jgi:cytochrome b
MAEPLTVDKAPQAIRSTPHGSQVRELLAVYQEVLDGIDDLPPVPMVLRKHRGRLHYRPRTKWPVRYFVVRHLQRTLASLTRRYSARAALGQQADGEQQDREAVREFQQSLPPDRQKIYVLLLIAAIFILFGRVITWLVDAYETKSQGNSQIQQLKDAGTKIVGALNADARAMNDAVNAVASSRPLGWCLFTLGVMLSAYVVLRPLMPAFRLKRMIFNLAPEPDGRHRSAVARWSVSQATGLYECERRVFAELGVRPPPEFPHDLAVSALAMVLPLIYCGLFFQMGVQFLELTTSSSSSADHLLNPDRMIGFEGFGFTILLLALILVRLGWLCRTWRRRRLHRTGPYMPYEVRIRSGRAVANVANPIGWRLLVFLSILSLILATGAAFPIPIFITFVFSVSYSALVYFFLSLPWWNRINRELRDLDRSYDSKQASSHPLGSLLMMALGWPILLPPFIAVFRIVRHIQRAQARAAGPVRMWSPWILTPGLLFPPVLFAYLQHELNKVWAVEGEPLDPWAADTSREASRSTGTLPWLKAKGPNHRQARARFMRRNKGASVVHSFGLVRTAHVRSHLLGI